MVWKKKMTAWHCRNDTETNRQEQRTGKEMQGIVSTFKDVQRIVRTGKDVYCKVL